MTIKNFTVRTGIEEQVAANSTFMHSSLTKDGFLGLGPEEDKKFLADQ